MSGHQRAKVLLCWHAVVCSIPSTCIHRANADHNCDGTVTACSFKKLFCAVHFSQVLQHVSDTDMSIAAKASIFRSCRWSRLLVNNQCTSHSTLLEFQMACLQFGDQHAKHPTCHAVGHTSIAAIANISKYSIMTPRLYKFLSSCKRACLKSASEGLVGLALIAFLRNVNMMPQLLLILNLRNQYWYI